jgi:hypothetical protein
MKKPDDPNAEHWQLIVKAAEAVVASRNCTAEQCMEFCAALDRLTAALLGHHEDKGAANG